MNKWLTIGVVALAVYLLSRRAPARGDPYAAGNWAVMPGYSAGTGTYV